MGRDAPRGSAAPATGSVSASTSAAPANAGVGAGGERSHPNSPIGAILAGGRNRRFGGEPKALAEVGGRPILERVRAALGAVLADVVLITNDPEPYERFGLETRGDAFEDAGPLAGVHAALVWAKERGRPGALCVACDMPFVTAPLLRALLAEAGTSGAATIVPESPGPRGVEPLCAYYSVAALETVESRARAGVRELVGLLDALNTQVVPRAEVERSGDAAVLFLNVNDPTELRRARRVASEASPDAATIAEAVDRRAGDR